MMEKKIALILLMVFLIGSARAVQIAYEPFEGADGTDINNTGSGVGWAVGSNWTASSGLFQYSDPGNDFGELETMGQKALFLGSGGATARYNRLLSSPVIVDDQNPEAWVSVLVEIGSGGGDVNAGRGIGIELTSEGTSIVAIGKKLNGKFGIGTDMTTNWNNSTVGANTVGVRFLALQLEYDGTDTIATVYIADGEDQAGLDMFDVGTFVDTSSLTISGPVTIDGVTLYGYHPGTTSNTLDEIQIAEEYLDFFLYDIANTPTPTDQESLVPVDTNLSWLPPDLYTSEGYRVYFGQTEPNDLQSDYGLTELTGGTPENITTLDPAPAGDLANNTQYYWVVDAYEPNTPTPILHPGSHWSFTTIPATVVITADPEPLTVAPGGTAVFTVAHENAADFVWKKDGSPLSEGGKFSGTNTATLTITDVQQAEEGFYSCTISNTVPSEATTESALLMTQRLVARYQFENNLDDTNGSADMWPGVIVDPCTGNAEPASVSFAGESENVLQGSYALQLANLEGDEGGYVEVPGTTDTFDFLSQGITVSAWVKTTYSDTYTAIVAKNGDVGEDWFLRKSFNGSLFRVGPTAPVYGPTITDGQWHFIVGQYDPADGMKKIYSDGILADSKEVLPDKAGNDGLLTIGNEIGSDGYNGWIDDVRVYSYALTPEEVAQLYFDVTGIRSCINAYGDPELEVDVNGDCIIDLLDFASLALYWLDTGLYPAP